MQLTRVTHNKTSKINLKITRKENFCIIRGSGIEHSVFTLNMQTPKSQGPVVQSVVSLTSSLRVISLTVLADSIHNILIIFVEKM